MATRATRSAKEFLIGQILIEADRENVPLSGLERQMLEFSESEKTPSNIAEFNAEFEREYDSVEYEEKIASLIRNRIANLRAIHSPELDQWNEAVSTLAGEDHYLLVMIEMGQSRFHSPVHSGRPPHDRLVLFLTAAGIVALLTLIGFIIAR